MRSPWTSECRVDGVELLRFLADEDFRGPVLIISGFDRRVLESAFRLGEAQGLNMAGPLEKPVRLEELETVLKRLQAMLPYDGRRTKLLESFKRALASPASPAGLSAEGQPKDGQLTRVEALVRWDDPELGPSRALTLRALGREAWLDRRSDPLGVCGRSFKPMARWRDQGIDTSLAFNISALSLQHLDFPDLGRAYVPALDVPTDRLVLELTEGATQPLVRLMDTLTRFRIKGIGLAIDDFGTGYSSLMQLRQLPFTEVKIDRSFVADLPIAHALRG